MTTAILSVHAKNGPWVTESGYEYNLVLIATAFVIAANPGDWSLDAALGLGEIHGTAFALGALVLGVAGGTLALIAGRAGKGPASPPTPTDEAPATAVPTDPRFERAPADDPQITR